MENNEKQNQEQFIPLEDTKGKFKMTKNCQGDACDHVEWEVTNYPSANLVKRIVLTNLGDKKIRIQAAWGNVLGGCGVGPFDFMIAPGRSTTLNFTRDQMILGYCKFKAHFTNSSDSEFDGLENFFKDIIRQVNDGSLEPAIFTDSINGNQVWFWKQGNNSYLRLLNDTDEPQRTDYMITVRKDGEWRVHTTGYFILEPKTEYTQGFHRWYAQDWDARWQ